MGCTWSRSDSENLRSSQDTDVRQVGNRWSPSAYVSVLYKNHAFHLSVQQLLIRPDYAQLTQRALDDSPSKLPLRHRLATIAQRINYDLRCTAAINRPLINSSTRQHTL